MTTKPAMVRNLLHQTEPILVHAPGKAEESPWWNTAKRDVFAARHSYGDCHSLAIVTWNSGIPNPKFKSRGHTLGSFERSLAHAGVRCTVLGGSVGSAWKNRLKLDLTLEFLTSTGAEYVLGADSSDVLLVGDPANALKEFQDQDAGVLFNAEKNFWPPEIGDVKEFEQRVAVSPFRFFNAGLWIGRRVALIAAFQAARQWAERLESRPNSEQICWKYAYRDLYPGIRIDDRCRIFQTLNEVRGEISIGGRTRPRFSWFSRWTAATPAS